IAPDGKYVIYAVQSPAGYSLRIRHVATGSDVQIVPPLPTPFRGGGFSPDGNYVYYVNQETGGPGYSYLYQVPVLGGATRRLLFDIDTAVSFSPDGRRFVFMRGYPTNAESALIIADADGTGERKLKVRKDPARFAPIAPAWSPDGSRIAAVVFSGTIDSRQQIALFNATDGREAGTLGSSWFDVNGLHWLPDGTALAATASDRRGNLMHQIWLVPYPDGAARRVTNDLNDYADVSVTTDGRTLATTLRNRTAGLWVAPGGETGAAHQVAFGADREESIYELSSAGPGSLLVIGQQAETQRLWRIRADGSKRVDLTPSSAIPFNPAASAAGSLLAVALAGEEPMPHIFVVDRDGGDLRQVTHGESGEQLPALSPDGRFLLYASFGDRELRRVDLPGGEPHTIATDLNGSSVVSPDGRSVAFDSFVTVENRLRRYLVIIPSAGGAPIARIPWPEGDSPRWPPPGDAITYQRVSEGVGNVWSQPIDGGAPHPITHFTSDQIFDHDWSPDGRTLYLARGTLTH
ncbi:MAG TPA: hypothetical protein VNL37_02285, partial [Candidatus Polarisedimenticolia bacterium]|nr:hypothetical protein [Candidatus Polarisedimenticolia bacterium]